MADPRDYKEHICGYQRDEFTHVTIRMCDPGHAIINSKHLKPDVRTRGRSETTRSLAHEFLTLVGSTC